MGFIPQSFIEDLLSRVDIVDIINSYVSLRKAGRNYVACCPFHQEKTPSFCVVPTKQFYNCFGCGAAGSAIKFVMTIDNLDFVSAIEKLAAIVNMEIPRVNNPSEETVDRYKLLYSVMSQATEYYQHNLISNSVALDYIKQRAIDVDIGKFFLLGYAPDGWNNLSKIAVEQQALEDAGLWIKHNENQNNHHGYDRFRNRLMFPIRDLKGRVIAFGGRVLDDSKPKYLNSPETLLFHKSAELYGLYESLHISNQNKSKISKFVIVEGYMDVISLFQHGIYYAVATLGTATSYRHLSKLFKYCDEIVYCFDGDEAGKMAAWRALENSLSSLYDDRRIKFLFLPSDHDPDSFIHAYGKHEFEQQLINANSLPEYLFAHQMQLLGEQGLDTVEGKVKFINSCKPLLQKVTDATYRTVLETELARICNINQHSLDKILVDKSDNKLANKSDPVNAMLQTTGVIDPRFEGFMDNKNIRQVKQQASLWQKACLLVLHNPNFVNNIPEELVTKLKNDSHIENKTFIRIYELLKQVNTVPELIDSLADNLKLQHLIIKYLSIEPMVNDGLAEVEFNDLIKRVAKEQSSSEMEILRAKVVDGGMSSLTSVEKQRLQDLLLDRSY